MNPSLPQNQNTAAAPGVSSWWWLAGLLLGLTTVALSTLPNKWFLTVLAGIAGLSVSMAVADRKKFFLIVLVLSLPIGMSKTFWFTPSPVFRSSYGFTVPLTLIPLLALYIIWVFRRSFQEQPMPVSTRGLWLFAGIFAVALFSGLKANRLYAAFDLFALAISGLLFVYIASQILEERELRLVVVLLIIVGIFEATIAVIQNLTGSGLGLEFFGERRFIRGYVGLETLTRVTGTLGHPAGLAEFFDLIIPLSFSMLFYPMSTPLRFALFCGVVIEFMGLGSSYSRGGIFWTIVASASVLLIHLCRSLGMVRGAFFTLAIATLSLVLIVVVPNPIRKGLLRTEVETAYGRIPLMEVARNIISHHPLLGIGLNNYVSAAKKYDNTPQQLTTAWDTAVHNVYLYIAGEIGLIGMLFFLGLVATVLWHLLPAWRSTDPFIVCAGLGILFGLLGYLIHWLSDLAPWTTARLFWFMLGLAVAVGRLAKAASPTVSEPETVAAG